MTATNETYIIPEKFKTADGGANIAAILKSYSELEKRLSQIPSAPSDISEYPAIGFGERDDEIRAQFLELGLTKNQAEKICAMADELIAPVISEIAESKNEAAEMAELEKFFGGADKVAPALMEIEKFGTKYLPQDAFETLCSSHQGICSLYKMMRSNEPDISTNRNSSGELSENDLRRMMQDPKYWRDHDAEFIRSIERGFKKLFG